jgi:hypothetical protein
VDESVIRLRRDSRLRKRSGRQTGGRGAESILRGHFHKSPPPLRGRIKVGGRIRGSGSSKLEAIVVAFAVPAATPHPGPPPQEGRRKRAGVVGAKRASRGRFPAVLAVNTADLQPASPPILNLSACTQGGLLLSSCSGLARASTSCGVSAATPSGSIALHRQTRGWSASSPGQARADHDRSAEAMSLLCLPLSPRLPWTSRRRFPAVSPASAVNLQAASSSILKFSVYTQDASLASEFAFRAKGRGSR